MQLKNWQKVFYFWDNSGARLNLLREIVHIATGIHVMDSQRVNKQC